MIQPSTNLIIIKKEKLESYIKTINALKTQVKQLEQLNKELKRK
jgi:hypothetical protein